MILCYDIGVKRNAKVKKIARRYLRPVQESVCEGFLTDGKLKRLCLQLKNVIDPEEDSVVIYKLAAAPGFEKAVIGQALKNEDLIL
ncbi:MAG: CRISPR-associated endonuclease Cas2 [Clostridia bacterium]|nr:CRISPR-associated endonuclease Cas2 [Clostridia bacterium]